MRKINDSTIKNFFSKLIRNGHPNIIWQIMLASMLAASLCACSLGSPVETTQPSEPEIEVTVTEPDITEPENPADILPDDTTVENPPEVIPEEPPVVVILGTEYDLNTESLDLSAMTPDDVTAVAESIREMPELTTINLMPEEDASTLLLADVALLKEVAPNVHFIYEFVLFDNHVSTSDTRVEYINKPIGNEGEETLRQALTILDECEYFLLDDCGIDDEIMAGIREDFPNTKVVWRVHVGWKTALTDDPIIRMTHGIDDSMTGPLKYCNEVVYMDLGHDLGITDISFLENMPLLECLILSDAQFKDLTPVTYCTNLIWLELISCRSMENLSVISDMESIKYLNISQTNTRDISGIMNMNLDRFCCIGNYVPKEDFDNYKELHPDCMAVSSGNPYGYAWRYDDYGYHFFSYYARMREVFRYEQGSPGGFRWPEDEVSE